MTELINRSFFKRSAFLYVFPFIVLALLMICLLYNQVYTVSSYIDFQKDIFVSINGKLSKFPELMQNLTQLGDAFILLSFCGLLLLKEPKVWNALTLSLIISVVFSVSLKALFAVPRPYMMIDHNDFIVIGEPLIGKSSLPSGHTITVFTIMMTLFFSLLPQRKIYKYLFFFLALSVGVSVALSRVAVVAHYPFDTFVGAIIGYLSAVTGVLLSKRIYLWEMLLSRYTRPIILLFMISCAVMVYKIETENLVIYYFSFIALMVSLFKLIKFYIRKRRISNDFFFELSALKTSFLVSIATLLLFNYPFFKFALSNVDYGSFNGFILLVSLLIAMIVANTLVYYLILSISRRLGKVLLSVFFVINALSVYFVNTYGVIIDESMIGNVFNTNYSESSDFFSIKMLFYVVMMGIFPSIYLIKLKIRKGSFKSFLITVILSLGFLSVIVFGNSFNWLWIDKYSKPLGGLVMPWSYVVNTSRFFIHKSQENKQEILLPSATIKNDEKQVVVLIIGESARRENFSIYGYHRNTNPKLSSTENLFHYKATSCATYTTAGVKCILEHKIQISCMKYFLIIYIEME